MASKMKVTDVSLKLNLDIQNESDKKLLKSLKEGIRSVFKEEFSISAALDEKTFNNIQKRFASLAKSVGKAFGVQFADALTGEIKSLNFNKVGRKMAKAPVNAQDYEVYSPNLKTLAPASTYGKTIKYQYKENELLGLVEQLKEFGVSAKNINSIVKNFPKQMSSAHMKINPDGMYESFFNVNLGKGIFGNIRATSKSLGEGRFALENAELASLDYRATDAGKGAYNKIKTKEKELNSALKEKENILKLGQSEAEVDARIAQLQKEINKELKKVTQGQKQNLANQTAIKEARDKEKESARQVTEQQKQQNEHFNKAKQYLTEIHKYQKQMIVNQDKTASNELNRINKDKITELEKMYQLEVAQVSESQKQTLEAKKRIQLAEQERIQQEKLLKLRSSRSTRGNFLDETLTAMTRVASYGVAYNAINMLKRVCTSTIKTIIEFDKHMTNLSIVTQGQDIDVKQLTQSYIDLAHEVGASSTDVIAAADLWLRQGRSISETSELIKSTMYLSNIAMIDSAKSADILTSAINGFKLEAKDAMHVVDIFAAVDLAAAANTEELAEAMQRVAATAGEVGVSIENVTAYIGTLVDATRLDAGTIGSALNTILSRLQNIKLGSAVSDEGDNLSDAQKALRQVGIDLFDVNGSFKDMDTVLGELASKWSTLNDVERSSIAYAVAGTRQRNIFLQLMNNWNESLYLSAVALNSEGTALKKQEIYVDSYEAKVNQLSASWDKFLTKSTDSSLFKGTLDFLDGVLNGLDKIGFHLDDLIITLSAFIALTKKDAIADTIGLLTDKTLNKFSPKIKNQNLQLDFFKKNDIKTFGGYDDLGLGAIQEQIIRFGANSQKTVKLTKEAINASSKLTKEQIKNWTSATETWAKGMDKESIKRLQIYRENNLSAVEMWHAEQNLEIARNQTSAATLKAAEAEQRKNLSFGGKVKQFGSKMLAGVGKTLFAYEIISTIGSSISNAINEQNKAFLESAKQEIEELTKKISESGYSAAKDSFEVFEKIATQIGTEGITPELQKELTSIIEVLEKNFGSLIDVDNRIFKKTAEGNLEVKDLEALLNDYITAASNMTYDSFMGANAATIKELQSQVNAKNYREFGYGTDEAAKIAGISAGAAAGGIAGFSIPIPGWNILFGSLGALIGAGIGASQDYGIVEAQGEMITLEESIKRTERNIKELENQGKTKEALEVQKTLDELKDVQTQITETVEAIKEEYSSAFQIYAKASGQQQSLSATDIALVQSIVDNVAQEIDVNQLGTEKTYNILQKGIDQLVTYLSNADTQVSYTELAKQFAQGGYFAGLLEKNSTAMSKITATIQSNGPTFAKAVTKLREAIEEANENYTRQIDAADKRSTMLNSLATLGSDLGMSKLDISEMLNLGGDVNVNKIISPAYRKYAKELNELYEEYWGEDGKIANASGLETQEQLNSEYERAVSIKQKEYEILQKQLEVQKVQNKLNEAQRERNTLVFRNGHFMYETNPADLQQLKEEEEAAQREIALLEVQSDIAAYTKDSLDYLNSLATATEKIKELLEGDASANLALIKETIGSVIEQDLEDGAIDNPAIALLYESMKNMSGDYLSKIAQLGLFVDEEGNFNKNIPVNKSYDSGGLLQGKGLFSKQTSQDEVVLSATDAPKILNLLSRTGEFQETVNNADSLLRTLIMRESGVSSLLTNSLGNSIIYNIENVNVEEAEDIEGIVESASRIVKTTNPRFLRG